ncbi:MAG: TM0106 family RecB-like putative nuclease [Candidatus Obscuribacterales bacterium]|nr:TM0106 family RecB-like putative nuclease [Candidatus Obscuribacterales bacterium]
MRKVGDELLYSPSDLITFMESRFDSWMERFFREYPGEIQPDAEDDGKALVAQHGNIHEAAFLAKLQERGADIAEITGADEIAFASTIQAMRDGREVIYQGYLRSGQFAGRSDFLVRVDGTSSLGDYCYEVWDTKLSKKAKPYFAIQLCCYAEMMEEIQSLLPPTVCIVLGDFSQRTFRTRDFFALYQQIKKSFLQFQTEFRRDNPPLDCSAGSYSRWTSYSERILDERDDLSRVANITMSQARRLQKSGITTMTMLSGAQFSADIKIAEETFEKLRGQARLQIQSRTEGRTCYEMLPSVDGRGLTILPPRSRSDVFFDMEGYPHVEGGLEYLFGAILTEPTGQIFKDWWAHDRVQEKQAFREFITWIYSRWMQDSTMHIYHYASYEVSAVRRLAGRHGIMADEVDQLLRNEVFVDLYQVVRQGVRVGEPSYSIKYVEHLYREKRSGTVSKATDSVVFYERWLEVQDGPVWEDSAILKEIRDYNEEDCVSTLQLAEWLWLRQAESNIVYAGKLVQTPPAVPMLRESQILAEEMFSAAEFIDDAETRRVYELLAGLLEFHRREDKPKWWRLFDRQKMSIEELHNDLDCLSGLKRSGRAPEPTRRSLGYEYTFDPNQDTKLESGQQCYVSTDLTRVRLASLDRSKGIATIVLGPTKEPPADEIALVADEFVDSRTISDSIFRVCQRWHANRALPQCLSDLLYRRSPRIKGRFAGSPVAVSDSAQDVAQAISKMQSSALCIQGPPGSGKTYTATRCIAELLKQGKTVGITSNSHKAIDNLLIQLGQLMSSAGGRFKAVKIGSAAKGAEFDGLKIESIKDSGIFFKKSDHEEYNVVAGTAWLFSREEAVGFFDYLFIDEAGQVSLANLTAMSPCTDNLVLLGDQMQLEQPIAGSHPGDCGQSSLEYLLEGRATIQEDMGVFLGTTRRMHPDICELISLAVYDGRLVSSADTHNQILYPPADLSSRFEKRAGIVWHPVEHSGNSQSSEQEVDAIEGLINDLLMCEVADKSGTLKSIDLNDILIVAPYNMQARKISSRISAVRVASVDKFQGQEAPIVILSMCASEGSSSPRGLEFLFSRSRLNVAISRAKTLAFIIGNPALLSTHFSSVDQMVLINFFCQIVEAGTKVPQAERGVSEWRRSA